MKTYYLDKRLLVSGKSSKINLDNYPIYPRIEFYNRNIIYNSDYETVDQIIEIQIPLKLEVPSLEGIISNKVKEELETKICTVNSRRGTLSFMFLSFFNSLSEF